MLNSILGGLWWIHIACCVLLFELAAVWFWYSWQCNKKWSHHCRGSRYTWLGVLSWCDVGGRSAVHGVFWGKIWRSDVGGGCWACPDTESTEKIISIDTSTDTHIP